MKKYLFGMFAIALAVAFSAYTTVDVFQYKFTGNKISDLDQPSQWVEGEGGEECGFSGTACYVESTASTLSAFRQLITNANPQTVAAVENISGVDVMAQKDAIDD